MYNFFFLSALLLASCYYMGLSSFLKSERINVEAFYFWRIFLATVAHITHGYSF